MRKLTIPLSKYSFIDIINKPKRIRPIVTTKDIAKSIKDLFNSNKKQTSRVFSYSCDRQEMI